MENVNQAIHALQEDDPKTAFWKLLIKSGRTDSKLRKYGADRIGCLSEMLSLSLSYGFTSKTKYAKILAEEGISRMQQRPFMPLQQTETAEMLLKCSELWENLPVLERPLVSMKISELSSTQKPVLIYVHDREERKICSLSTGRRRLIKGVGIGIIFYSRFYKVDPDFDFETANINLFRNFSTHCFNEPPVDQEFVYITDSTSGRQLHAHGTNPILQDSVFLGFVSFAYPTTDYFQPTRRSKDRRLLRVFFDEVDDIVSFKLNERSARDMNCWERKEAFSTSLHSFYLYDEQTKAMRLEHGCILKRCDESIPVKLQLFNGSENAELLGEWKHYSGVETTMHESSGRVGLSTELIQMILCDFAGWKGYTSGSEAGLADIDAFLENENSFEYVYESSTAYLGFRNTAIHVFNGNTNPSEEAPNHSDVESDELENETNLSDISASIPLARPTPSNEAPTKSDVGTQVTPSFQSTAQHILQQQKQPSPRFSMPPPQPQAQTPPQIPTQNMFQIPTQNVQPTPHQQQQFFQQPFMQQQVGFTAGSPPAWQQPQQNWQQQSQQNRYQHFQQTHSTQHNMFNQAPSPMSGSMTNMFVPQGSPTPTPSFGTAPPTPTQSPFANPNAMFTFPNQSFSNPVNTPSPMLQSNNSNLNASPQMIQTSNPQMMQTNPQMMQVNSNPQMMQVNSNPQMMQVPQMMQANANPMMQPGSPQIAMRTANVLVQPPFHQNQVMGNGFMTPQRANMMMNPFQMQQQRNMMSQFQQQQRQNMLGNPFQSPQVPFLQVSPQQMQAQMGMQFPVPPPQHTMTASEQQSFMNLQRLMSTPLGRRLFASNQVSTQQILQMIEAESTRMDQPTNHNDQMARELAAQHREKKEAEQRDLDALREQCVDFVEDDDDEKREDRDSIEDRERMEFELPGDNETLENLGENYKDNVELLSKRITELESLKRSYSGGGFKKMRSVVNNAIRKLKGTLQKLTLEDEIEHSIFYPLTKRHRDFRGLEVKFVACPEDCAIVIQDVGFLRVKVRTFGKLACRDTLPRLDKVHGIVRQSRDIYALKIRKNNVFKSHPNICYRVAEYLYYDLIPMEIYILGERINYLPQYFPVVWQVYGLIDTIISDWEPRYFQSFQFEQADPEDVDLRSSPFLFELDNAYFTAMASGQKKFIFKMYSTKEKCEVNDSETSI